MWGGRTGHEVGRGAVPPAGSPHSASPKPGWLLLGPRAGASALLPQVEADEMSQQEGLRRGREVGLLSRGASDPSRWLGSQQVIRQ